MRPRIGVWSRHGIILFVFPHAADGGAGLDVMRKSVSEVEQILDPWQNDHVFGKSIVCISVQCDCPDI